MISFTDLSENYCFVYAIYDRNKKVFCDSNNHDFIIKNIVNAGIYSDEMYSFGCVNDVIEWFNTIFDGRIHFRSVLYGKNEHKSKNNPTPTHLQKELNQLCTEEHCFWLNKGYEYDNSLIYDEIEVLKTINDNIDILPDYHLRQRLKDEIHGLIMKRDDIETELNTLNEEISNNKSIISKQKYGIQQNEDKLNSQKENLEAITKRYINGTNITKEQLQAISENADKLHILTNQLNDIKKQYDDYVIRNENLVSEIKEYNKVKQDLEYLKTNFKVELHNYLKELQNKANEWINKNKDLYTYLENLEGLERDVKMYKNNNMTIPQWEIDMRKLKPKDVELILKKYQVEIK